MSITKMTDFSFIISFTWYDSTKIIYFHIIMNYLVYKLAYFCNIIRVGNNAAENLFTLPIDKSALLCYNLIRAKRDFRNLESPVNAYFSEQNFTSLPSSIIFVVLTAHIFPHIEQV